MLISRLLQTLAIGFIIGLMFVGVMYSLALALLTFGGTD